MKAKFLLIIAIIGLSILPAAAENNLAQRLTGRILLQVEAHGQAWYVNPADQKRYFLGRPTDALNLMRQLGMGITNNDLAKIATPGQQSTDLTFAKQNAGRILLQVQNTGQAWYVNPVNYKRYFLGRPADAWQIMRNLALGITDKNLEQITIGQLQLAANTTQPPAAPPTAPPANPAPTQTSVLDQAAASIRNNNSTQAQSFFIASMRKSIDYSLAHLSAESRLLLANILSGAKLTGSTNEEKTYSTTAYFSLKDMEVPLSFHVQKQADGQWLITNL